METLIKIGTAILSFITACIGFSAKVKTSKTKYMNRETIPYFILLAAFLLLAAATCYLARINLRK